MKFGWFFFFGWLFFKLLHTTIKICFCFIFNFVAFNEVYLQERENLNLLGSLWLSEVMRLFINTEKDDGLWKPSLVVLESRNGERSHSGYNSSFRSSAFETQISLSSGAPVV